MPHRLKYALLGALLSSGAPLGLLLVRFLESGGTTAAWIRLELTRDPLTYAYVTCSTMVVFFVFGLMLGWQVDCLEELSALDPVTRLANGRVFQERLQQEEERVARYGGSLSLLLVDIDRLKEINDRHGHRTGTDALVKVASAIRRVARSTDLAARWGGDEFAVLAPQTPPSSASRLGERIRSALAEDTTAVAVTVSIGVATLDPASDGIADKSLWERADAALYEAKRQGRDRAVSFISR